MITGLSLTVKQDEVIYFHKNGKIIGWIKLLSKDSVRISFNFPENLNIDREVLYKKKYNTEKKDE